MSKARKPTPATAALTEAHAERDQVKHYGQVVQSVLSNFNERANELLELLRERGRRQPLRLVKVKK